MSLEKKTEIFLLESVVENNYRFASDIDRLVVSNKVSS